MIRIMCNSYSLFFVFQRLRNALCTRKGVLPHPISVQITLVYLFNPFAIFHSYGTHYIPFHFYTFGSFACILCEKEESERFHSFFSFCFCRGICVYTPYRFVFFRAASIHFDILLFSFYVRFIFLYLLLLL